MEELIENINDKNKFVVSYIAPSTRVSIGEAFGVYGENSFAKMNGFLKGLGVDYSLDMTYGADLTIVEEATEFLKILQGDSGVKLPMFTSCCPIWVNVAKRHGKAVEHLSSTKSPQEIYSSLLKNYLSEKLEKPEEDIIVVSIVPCVMKKMEAMACKTTDLVINVAEVQKYMLENDVEFPALNELPFDDLFGQESGSGVIFGRTGGVMESAFRMVNFLITGNRQLKFLSDGFFVEEKDGVKVYELAIDEVSQDVNPLVQYFVDDWGFVKGRKIRYAVVCGGVNVDNFLHHLDSGDELISSLDFVEFMTCDGGCIGGAGQPHISDEKKRVERVSVIDKSDNFDDIKVPCENPYVVKLYKQFFNCGFGESKKVHKLFHKKY